MIVYLTQYNIECMSVSLDLHSGHVSPMEFNVENEKKPTNFSGGYRGVYDELRYQKIVSAKLLNGWVPGRPHGYSHTPEAILKMKNKNSHNLEISKKIYLVLTCIVHVFIARNKPALVG